jgi:tetratricopeptide (TPR) repeat protein
LIISCSEETDYPQVCINANRALDTKEKIRLYSECINHQDFSEEGKYANSYLNRAKTYKKLGQYKLAIQDYGDVIRLNPENAGFYKSRGFLYEKAGNDTHAIRSYTKAIELDPKLVNAYYNRGNCYERLGKNTLALNDYNKTVELNPKNVNAYYNLGIVHRKKGELDLAIQNYGKTIALNPKYFEAYHNRGRINKKLGQYELALHDFNKAIEINPKYTKAYYDRGNVYVKIGNNQKAFQDYDKIIEINPNHMVPYFNLALIHLELGDYFSTVKNCRKAIELHYKNPKNPYSKIIQTYYTLGIVYTKIGRIDLAIQYYEKSLEIDPNYSYSANNLAILLLKTKNFKLHNPKRAYFLASRNVQASKGRVPAYLSTLATAFAELGQLNEAIEAQTKALGLVEKRGNTKRIESYREDLDEYKQMEASIQTGR